MLENLALRLAFGPKLQLPANAGPGRLQVIQVVGCLLPTWEMWIVFPVSELTVLDIWGVNQ